MDGNGRMGRFVLNAMLASGGYNWTVVPVERRKEYMKALERPAWRGYFGVYESNRIIGQVMIFIIMTI